MVGVVEHGLFTDVVDRVIIGNENNVVDILEVK